MTPRRPARRPRDDQPPQVDAADRVDAGARLVEDQQRRPVHDRHAEPELAAHPAGQLGGEPVRGRRQARRGEQLRAARRERLAGQAVDAADEVDVLRHGQAAQLPDDAGR